MRTGYLGLQTVGRIKVRFPLPGRTAIFTTAFSQKYSDVGAGIEENTTELLQTRRVQYFFHMIRNGNDRHIPRIVSSSLCARTPVKRKTKWTNGIREVCSDMDIYTLYTSSISFCLTQYKLEKRCSLVTWAARARRRYRCQGFNLK